jgi:hypothetical protein
MRGQELTSFRFAIDHLLEKGINVPTSHAYLGECIISSIETMRVVKLI